MNELTTAAERLDVLRARIDDIERHISVIRDEAHALPLTVRIEVNNLQEVLDLLRVKLYQLENP